MPYLTLLRSPFVLRLLFGSLVGRLPSAMALLAIPLVLRRSGLDYGFVGVAMGLSAVAAAVGGPLAGRLVDRVGQVRVLVPTAVGSVVGFAVLAVAGDHRVLVVVGVVLAGAATPPLEPCLRALWPVLVDAERLEAAYSMDSAAQELIFVGGPLVVAGCVAWAAPVAALWVGALLVVVGVAIVVGAAPVRGWRAGQRAADWLGPLRHGGLTVVLGGFVGVGMALGMLNVLVVSYAEQHHVPGGAPVLFALNAAGSLIGALVYGAVRWRGPAPTRLLWLRMGLLAGYSLLFVVPSPPLMVLTMVATGLFLAPVLTVTFVLVGELAPAGTVTEAFAWLVTLFTTGAAIGSAVTGYALDHVGMGTAAVTGVAGISASVLVQLAGRRQVARPASREELSDPELSRVVVPES